MLWGKYMYVLIQIKYDYSITEYRTIVKDYNIMNGLSGSFYEVCNVFSKDRVLIKGLKTKKK